MALPSAGDLTVGVLLSRYYRDRLSEVRSPDAIRFAIAALDPRLGALYPDDLLPAVVRGYANERGASPGTILREIGVLRAALAWGVENRWIAQAPIISNPVKAPPPRDRWITRDEARHLIAACWEPHIRLFVILGLTTAARMGAILELKWAQIDLASRLVDYGPGHGRKRRAVVPLNDDALRALSAAQQLASSEFVIEFRGQRVKSVKNGFQAACDRAGLRDVTPHILRHSAATWMVADGVPIAQVARVLGDTEATTERVYAKHAPGYLSQAVGALNLAR